MLGKISSRLSSMERKRDRGKGGGGTGQREEMRWEYRVQEG